MAAVAESSEFTQEAFDTKVAWVKAWTYGGEKVTNDEKLKCYGLFKQVTVGDVQGSQPYARAGAHRRARSLPRARRPARAQAIQFEKRAKWDAWNTRKGMSKEDAIREYITEVDAQHAKYGDGP